MSSSALPLVWITRTAAGAQKTARAVEALGYEALIAPVLRVAPLKPVIDPHSFDAVIFTSRNGVEAFSSLCSRRALTAWCVGEATAAAAQQHGFQTVISADGNVGDLIDLIRRDSDRHSRLLHAAPREPAGDLCETLRADGFQVSEVAVYETQAIRPPLSPADLARLRHILIHSPRGGRAVADVLLAHYDKLHFPKLCFICISEAAWQGLETTLGKAMAAGLERRIAATPDEAAMLRLLDTDK
ncbi:MAG: uroporphyrinogen-III synthase [Asticcacaulis sp.]|uniref:uroporphyrinogen-III synthase n=1 Tax=Asticcacaulis sp. TaxID=1872648 RepID=UPI0039E4CC1A